MQRLLQQIQRKRWTMYVVAEGLLGIIVGYYTVPRFQWVYVIVGILSILVGAQLSLMRQHRRTWQSKRIVDLLDSLERMCTGIMLVITCIYGLTEKIPQDVFAAVVAWSGFCYIAGNAGGEYFWQFRRFPRLGTSEQVRYLCRYHQR